jgi:hypothetical protein
MKDYQKKFFFLCLNITKSICFVKHGFAKKAQHLSASASGTCESRGETGPIKHPVYGGRGNQQCFPQG